MTDCQSPPHGPLLRVPPRRRRSMPRVAGGAIGICKVCALVAVVLLASCGDDASAPPATRGANDGGSRDATVANGPDAGSAADAAIDAGDDAGDDASPAGPPQRVGGQLAGLTPGESITLQNDSGDDLTLSANGTFTFAKPVAAGEIYTVKILTPPSSPIAQTCTVWDGTGTIGSLPVTDVRVNCDLLAYFPFSANVHDESGYRHDGVVSGATLTTDRNGNANSAYAFSKGATIQATMPVGFLPVNDQPRTLTAWLRPSESNNALNVIFWGAGNCTALQFGLGDQGDKAAFWGGCDDYASTLALPVGKWTFVAITYSPTTPTSISVYVDATSATGTITALATGGSPSFAIGGSTGSSTFFTGNIDSVRVYGHALQPAEVASLLTAPDP